jgi:hypothetical protein
LQAELEATREQMSEHTRQLREQLDDLEARERSLQGRLHDTQAAAQQAAQDHHKEAQRRTEEVQQLQLQVCGRTCCAALACASLLAQAFSGASAS